MKHIHEYSNLSSSEYDELYSNFLVNSWSYSKVMSFARNEKAFEMNYIYNERSKSSSSTVAGNAYHAALERYFINKKDNLTLDLVDLEKIAFEYIDNVKANIWKLQKTTKTISECQIKASSIVSKLLENFINDISVYDIVEVISVEDYFNEFLQINGVDIPLPCHAKIDLIAKTSEGKTIIIDHKSKNCFSDEKELALSIGKQAITYYKVLEAKMNIIADEVWFIENKYSKNRDGSPQLNCFKMPMDNDTVKLYEAMLYEPLKRMIEAVSNPDYVYLMNENDTFVSKEHMHAFWSKTMIAEIDEFNVDESKKDIISRRLKKIRDASTASINPKIIKTFRKNASEFILYDLTNKDMNKTEKIEHILRSLGLVVKVEHFFEGYSSDAFLLSVSAGTTLNKIFKYKLDIASALDVSSIRIDTQLKVYDGKSYIHLECGKKNDKVLSYDPKYLIDGKIPIGMDNFNNVVYFDVENPATAHALVCGSTGSGKSVMINSTIEYAKLLDYDEIIIFDPKNEFNTKCQGIVRVIRDIDKIEIEMEKLVEQMQLLTKTGRTKKTFIVFDEFADALDSSKKGRELDVKEMVEVGFYAQKKGDLGPPKPKMKLQTVGRKKSLEENLKMILQKGRSLGFRVIAATQRASVKVISGDAKVNFPVQICFRVSREIDSKVVLDQGGAETLGGKGDGLISSPEYHGLVRFQGFYKEI